LEFGYVLSSMVILQSPFRVRDKKKICENESETFLVHFVIEMYFTAVAVLISNSVCRNCGVPIAAFEFSSQSFIHVSIV
jgi:hypothetical protein